jgi:hypothetical protein
VLCLLSYTGECPPVTLDADLNQSTGSRQVDGTGMRSPQRVDPESAVIDVPPVINVQDMDHLAVLIDHVPYTIFAAPGAPVAREGSAQRRANSVRFLCQRSPDELVTGPGDPLRQPLWQLPGSRG